MGRRGIKIGIEMGGIRQFERTVKRFEKQYIKAVKRVVAETAQMIKSQAQALAPVDDGNLRQSIEVRFYKRGLSAEIIVGASYGIYVEFGTGIYAKEGNGRKEPWVYWSEKLGRFVYTRGMKSQPYWSPALEAGSKYFEREMNKLGA